MTRTGANHSDFTIRAALQLPVMLRGVPEVLSGEGQLDRPIRWAHACEIPDIASTLQGGELLLTTGLGIDRTRRGQQQFVEDVADRSVAGMIIELGRRFPQLPGALIETARLRDLPLVVLHRDVRFIDIIEVIHRRIVDSESLSLRRRDDLHHGLSELMRAGRGPEEVLGLVAEVVGNPVVLEKDGDGVLYHARHRSTPASVLAGLQAVRRGLPGQPPCIEQVITAGPQEPWGRLVTVGLETPIEDFDAVAMERAAGVIAVMLLRTREEDRLARRERWNLLADLLRPELDETDAEMRALDVGFATTAMVPFAAGGVLPGVIDEADWSRIWHELETELSERHVAFIGGTEGSTGRAVLSLKSTTHREEVADAVAAILHKATERHTAGRGGVAVSFGRAGHSWGAMRDGLSEAQQALDACRFLTPRRWHDASRPDLGRLLGTLRDQPDVSAFVDARLRPIVEYDRLRNSQLLRTVEVLCQRGANKSATARALHLERQSLYHRLARVEQLLGVSLDDEDVLLGLHFAVRARRIFDRMDGDRLTPPTPPLA